MDFESIRNQIEGKGLNIVSEDLHRPWGGFFVLDESQIEAFTATYFPDLNLSEEEKALKQSPKILIVNPNKRLSWQYHHRRSELWRVVNGPVGVMQSPTDKPGPIQELDMDATVQIGQGIRHRLIGLGRVGVVAEIWRHTEPENPSNEDDIVRVEDDFGR